MFLSSLVLGFLLSVMFLTEVKAVQITEIETVGLKRIERDAVLEKIQSKVGKELSDEQVRSDIENLFSMGYFNDIQVSKNGGKLTYQFVERPVVVEVLFEGNEKIKTSDLEDVVKVKKWSILEITKVQQDVDLLQKHYEDKGYYLAKVSYEVRPASEGEVKLVYKIADYDKVEIKQINFINNHRYSTEQLKSVFAETKEGASVSFLSSAGSFKEASFKIDLQRLTYWYLEHGYLKFRYENPVVTVSDDKKYVYISIYVDEGDAYTIGHYDFSGDLLFTRDELNKEIELLPGETFSISKRNADIQRLTEKYQDLGYAFTNVIPKMDFDEEAKTVSTDYQFEKGSLVYFNKIRVLGNTKTYDKVIRRELRIYEGELFSGSKLRISRERVERLGYFAPGEVQFNQVPVAGRDDLVDIEISVKERSTGSITLGAGYSSVQGFFFQGNVQEINLLGRGQTLKFEAQWGRDDIVRSFTIGFYEPYLFDTDWSGGIDLYMSNAPLPYRYLVRRSGTQLRTGRSITDDIQAYLSYKLEHLRVLRMATYTSTVAGVPNLVADPSLDVGILSSVTLGITRDVRNNRFETTSGNYQNASIEIAGLGGVKKFAKVILNNRYYKPLFGSFVFKNSTEFGAMLNTGGRGIPPAEKFYLGGPFNMRGYEAFSLSPFIMRPDGIEQIGGASEFYSLFEIEHPIIREAGIKAVLFYDIGNAFARVPLFESQSLDLRQNWGFGIRWFSPLGPLRFEWGFPISRKPLATNPNELESSPVFVFFIGQPF